MRDIMHYSRNNLKLGNNIFVCLFVIRLLFSLLLPFIIQTGILRAGPSREGIANSVHSFSRLTMKVISK